MDKTTPNQPRQGFHRTTLYLRSDQWERLQALEQQTGASPSFTVRKLLDARLRIRRDDSTKPAA